VNTPQSWTSGLTKAAWTLVVAAVLVFVAWKLLERVLGPLLVVLALIGIYRIALGVFRRDQW
jgi:CHASE2 domain-containing sensor protein